MIGATVRIVGTTQGGVSKAPDGRFTVSNIRVGDYTIKVTAVGYKPVEYSVRIEKQQITTITAQFVESVRVSACCFGCYLRPPLVRRERIGTTTVITAEELDRMP